MLLAVIRAPVSSASNSGARVVVGARRKLREPLAPIVAPYVEFGCTDSSRRGLRRRENYCDDAAVASLHCG